jgi:[lysine-biosynthesis-protein LysW]--L-2-aminoadipate ligase
MQLKQLKKWEKMGYPAVLKPVTGSWGRLVAPLRDKSTVEAIIESREFMNNPLHKIYYIQEMVDRPPRDIRTIVVGDKIITSVYRYAPEGEWRTNVARGGKSIPYPVSNEFEDLILSAAKAVGGGILGVDCMEGPDGLVVHEINNTVEFKGAMTATGVDVPTEILNYLKTRK